MSNTAIIIMLFIVPIAVYLLIKSLKLIGSHKRWSEAQKLTFSEEDKQTLLKYFPAYGALTAEEKKRLEFKINYFLLHKRISGIGELKVTPEMKLLIAANACLIITNLNVKEVYPGLKNVYVMESTYVEKENPVDPVSGRPLHVTRLGESWKRGPIVLSWDSIKQGIDYPKPKHNLIIHEFSHHLDQQDGYFDGTPKLNDQRQFHAWADIMGDEFLKLKRKVSSRKKSDIDSYGAVNEAEFFAVVTEYFFTDPTNLEKKHPDIFGIFLDYFKIDPRKWD